MAALGLLNTNLNAPDFDYNYDFLEQQPTVSRRGSAESWIFDDINVDGTCSYTNSPTLKGMTSSVVFPGCLDSIYGPESSNSESSSPTDTIAPASLWNTSKPHHRNHSTTSFQSSNSSNTISPISPTNLSFPPSVYALPRAHNPTFKTEPSAQSEFNPLFALSNDQPSWTWNDPAIPLSYSPTFETVSPKATQLKREPASPSMAAAPILLPSPGLTTPKDGLNSGLESPGIFHDGPEGPLFPTPQELSSRAHSGETFDAQEWKRRVNARSGSSAQQKTMQQQTGEMPGFAIYPPLTTAQATHLRSIAMPTSPKQDCESPPSSPDQSHSLRSRKRKESCISEGDLGDDGNDSDPSPIDKANGSSSSSNNNSSGPPVKKTAHNMIEKRYRTNLNDKIAALRDSVPSLRVTAHPKRGNGAMSAECEDLDGLTPASKLNKATILSKATEYISHLERRSRALTRENKTLKDRIEAFESLMIAREQQNGAMAGQMAMGQTQAFDMGMAQNQMGQLQMPNMGMGQQGRMAVGRRGRQ